MSDAHHHMTEKSEAEERPQLTHQLLTALVARSGYCVLEDWELDGAGPLRVTTTEEGHTILEAPVRWRL